jgi:phosphoribosylglycinamide formyltransferase-1
MIRLTKLWDPNKGTLNIAGLMSGSGSNLIKIIEHGKLLEEERGYSPYSVKVIFSDNPNSNAIKIGSDFAIPVLSYDLGAFCREIGADIKDLHARGIYEFKVLKVLNQFECPVFAYAGYMRKATNFFVNAAIGVNVHPADLSIVDEKGKRKYTGDKAVLNALNAGETELRASTHVITSEVDAGSIFMVSRHVRIDEKFQDSIVDLVAKKYQERLKEVGDWEIFPKTLEYIADGRYSKDSAGSLYFDEEQIPYGVRLD